MTVEEGKVEVDPESDEGQSLVRLLSQLARNTPGDIKYFLLPAATTSVVVAIFNPVFGAGMAIVAGGIYLFRVVRH